ncbi:MAG TPA: sensor histidine kinase [Symbiobacteriaceae bacterium]|nr:sensor histidine kinase [Symbiobacteriaceae bacterium]
MNWTMRLLRISRPLTLVVVMVAYMLDPQVTTRGLALYVVSAAFFIGSSAIIASRLETIYRWRLWTVWAELGLISYLNWHSLYFLHNNAVMACYMVAVVSIPLSLERKNWRPAIYALIASWILTTLLGLREQHVQEFVLVLGIYAGALLFFASTGVLMRNLQDEQARSKKLFREVSHSQAALERAHRQLQESAVMEQHMAVLEERQRLAREIHDSVAHGLTALVVQAQAARKLMDRDPARAAETVARCEEMAREALQETRRAVRALHPAGLEQQSDVDALQRLARDYGIATNMQVSVTADELARAMPPDPSRLEQLYRIFQEALTNAHRHGQAKNVSASIAVISGAVLLTITNDGLPPDSLDPGIGLKSMAERARSIGGAISYETGPVGLTIRVTVPLKQEVAG